MVVMDTTRIAVTSAAAAVVAWAAKAVAIGLAGGLDKSAFEGPLFLTGLVFFVVAVGSLAVGAVGPSWWARATALTGAVVAVVVAIALAGMGVDALTSSDHWVWNELNLWVLSLGVLALGAWRSSRREPVAEPAH